ncbi:uncharacterized protein [Kogia breviceps]|uniref:uncharacterized protein n=1 Tax=Kogia breviceps TaxID=27615 RepID=UPI0034D15C53
MGPLRGVAVVPGSQPPGGSYTWAQSAGWRHLGEVGPVGGWPLEGPLPTDASPEFPDLCGPAPWALSRRRPLGLGATVSGPQIAGGASLDSSACAPDGHPGREAVGRVGGHPTWGWGRASGPDTATSPVSLRHPFLTRAPDPHVISQDKANLWGSQFRPKQASGAPVPSRPHRVNHHREPRGPAWGRLVGAALESCCSLLVQSSARSALEKHPEPSEVRGQQEAAPAAEVGGQGRASGAGGGDARAEGLVARGPQQACREPRACVWTGGRPGGRAQVHPLSPASALPLTCGGHQSLRPCADLSPRWPFRVPPAALRHLKPVLTPVLGAGGLWPAAASVARPLSCPSGRGQLLCPAQDPQVS